MNKYLACGLVIFAVVCCYLILTVAMPVITNMASTAATTIPDTYSETQAGLNYAPLVMYFIPGIIGVGTVVMILKKGK